jgi:hypothetical protein
LGFITTGGGTAQEIRKLSRLQGFVPWSASAGSNRFGSKSWTLVSVFRASWTGDPCVYSRKQISGVQELVNREQTKKDETNRNDRLIAVASKSPAHVDLKSISNLESEASRRG